MTLKVVESEYSGCGRGLTTRDSGTNPPLASQMWVRFAMTEPSGVQVEAGLEGGPAVLGGLDGVGALDLLGSSLGDGAALGG